jgi:signal transduction histidine kinase
MNAAPPFAARAIISGDGEMLSADEPLASLQARCGGEIPGIIAIPALREIVEKALEFGLQLARSITMRDVDETIRAFVRVSAPGDDGTCTLSVDSWQASPAPPETEEGAMRRERAVDRALAECTARLDASQRILTAESSAPDLLAFARLLREGQGKVWTDFVEIVGNRHEQPMHWRLLDGAEVRLRGSTRRWSVMIEPAGIGNGAAAGFDLYFITDDPAPAAEPSAQAARPALERAAEEVAIGREIAPVLRQPIARIIANAETIRTKMAGPLADEYSQYAADIANAGQHLLALVDDLSDLEVVESEEFSTAPDRIDLADVARRAVGILGVRAAEKDITLDAPDADESAPAIAEFRRVLQILLNLVGNALNYAPGGSQVWLRVDGDAQWARITVADQGPGLSEEQAARAFGKFERLGRSGDGGSGLGLYISRRLARAMGGDLVVDSAPGQGARFTLSVPADQGA